MTSIAPKSTRPRSREIAVRVCLFICLTSTTVGCATPRGPLFEPLAEPVRWPAPPETPRIEYVGQLATSADLKPARNFGQRIDAFLFGEPGTHSMLSPFALCTDGGDRLFVCDTNAQLVHMFDLESRKYEQWRPSDPDDEEGPRFSQPVGVAWDFLDRLLVSDSVAGVVHAFDASGAYLGELGAGRLGRPAGIAVDAEHGRIFVADPGRHQVIVLAIDGEELGAIGRRGTGPGEFNYPTNVALDRGGRIYVSDSLNFRVQVFESDLSFVRQIGSKGDLPGYFSQPKGIALDAEGHIYVVDAHFESVQVFDSEGTLLLAFGEEGHGPGQFWLPAGICIDARNRIWVADSYNCRVQLFEYLPEAPP